ncbi:MAG TPA: hypothetical protein VGQ83_39555 [Polyangia bacterium]|jgi:hypothetical protein
MSDYRIGESSGSIPWCSSEPEQSSPATAGGARSPQRGATCDPSGRGLDTVERWQPPADWRAGSRPAPVREKIAHLAHEAHLAAEAAEAAERCYRAARHVRDVEGQVKSATQMRLELRRLGESIAQLQRRVDGRADPTARQALSQARARQAGLKARFAPFLAKPPATPSVPNPESKLAALKTFLRAQAAPKPLKEAIRQAVKSAVGHALVRADAGLHRPATTPGTAVRLGRTLQRAGSALAKPVVGRALLPVVVAADGYNTYREAASERTYFKVVGALRGGAMGGLIAANPAYAIADIFLPKGYKPGELLRGGALMMTGIEEAVLTGDTRAGEEVQRRAKAGRYGEAARVAAEAGEFWGRDGVGRELATVGKLLRNR